MDDAAGRDVMWELGEPSPRLLKPQTELRKPSAMQTYIQALAHLRTHINLTVATAKVERGAAP